MTKHKFQVGDLVRINKVMPSMMSHFTCDEDAIVTKYFHNECQKGSDWEHCYSLFIKGHGKTSWYYDSNLKLRKHNQIPLLEKWEAQAKAEEKQKSNLDWILLWNPILKIITKPAPCETKDTDLNSQECHKTKTKE